jgi:hypothetical protein
MRGRSRCAAARRGRRNDRHARPHGDETKALAKVRQECFGELLEKDLHFFLGTTQQWHQVAPSPWVIIGVLPIPHETQLGLF